MYLRLEFYARILDSNNYIGDNCLQVCNESIITFGKHWWLMTECMYLRLASIIGILLSHGGQWKLSAANNSFNLSEVYADCLVRCSSSPLGIISLVHSGQEWVCKKNHDWLPSQHSIPSNGKSHEQFFKSRYKKILSIKNNYCRKTKSNIICVFTHMIHSNNSVLYYMDQTNSHVGCVSVCVNLVSRQALRYLWN